MFISTLSLKLSSPSLYPSNGYNTVLISSIKGLSLGDQREEN
jgi:hypothetical protein